MKKRSVVQALVALPLLAIIIAIATSQASAGIYSWPTNWSLGGIASWSQPLIASGTTLPNDASGTAGDLFMLDDTASQTWYRHNGSGFAQIRDAATLASLGVHVADSTDPHGQTTTFSNGVNLGAGTPDAYVSRLATGMVQIATWAVITPSTASPTSPATGTMWNDPAAGIKIWDHHGSWSTVITDYPAWQDLRVSLLSTKLSGSNEPGLTVVRTNGGGSQGVLTYAFDKASEEELYTSVQLPHDCYKTVIEPHIHWMPSDAGAGTVTWCIEYSLTNHLATQSATTTIATCSQQTNGIDRQHLIADFPAIDISTAKDSAIMLFRVYRAAAYASDTYDADAFATDFDLHYQVRNRGSEDEYGDND